MAGTIHLSKEPVTNRLGKLHSIIEELMQQQKPDILAIERAFVSHNAHTALKLGQVRGVVMALAEKLGISIFEYSPRTIKLVVTGSGRADKQQVQKMIQWQLKLSKLPQTDCADAMAVALCHSRTLSGMTTSQPRNKRRNTRWTERDLAIIRNHS